MRFLNRQRGQLKAGEFQFKASASIDEAIDTLIEGKAILHSLTIPEGLTSEQIVAAPERERHPHRRRHEIPREGTLLPDTYKFERGMTRQQIVNRMQPAQREALNQVWERRSPDLPIKTPQELVILASIVEKETGRADERTRVAAVFINRLGKRMRLQSDPTIVYGLFGGKGTLGRGILRSRDRASRRPTTPMSIDGPAAGADRQSRPRRARGRGQPVADQGPVFRRRRHRRPRLRRDATRAQPQRRALAPGREGPRRRRARSSTASSRRRRPDEHAARAATPGLRPRAGAGRRQPAAARAADSARGRASMRARARRAIRSSTGRYDLNIAEERCRRLRAAVTVTLSTACDRARSRPPLWSASVRARSEHGDLRA